MAALIAVVLAQVEVDFETVRAARDGEWVTIAGHLILYHQDGRFNKALLSEEMYLPLEDYGTAPTAENSVRITFGRGVDVGKLAGRPEMRVSGELQKRTSDPDHPVWVVNAVPGRAPKPVEPPAPESGMSLRYSALETARNGAIPAELAALDGRWLTLTGNLWVPYAAVGEVRDFMLAKNPWDGCCLGVPPTAFDSVEVRLREGETLSNPMAPFATVSGRFRIDRREIEGELVGLFRIVDAVEGNVPEGGAPGVRWGGVLLPMGLLAAMLAWLTWRALARSARLERERARE
jgi:hypothetical protein